MQPGAEAAKIMVVGNEPSHRHNIVTLLERCGFSTVSAPGNDDTLAMLRADPEDVDVLLIERAVSDSHSLDILSLVRQNPLLQHVPVIFHAPPALSNDIRVHIAAGAHYYLPEPCDADLLVSVVQAAANDSVQRRCNLAELESFNLAHTRLRSGRMEFREFEEASKLANFFAALCPEPTKVLLGFSEILENAVEHGNLEIGYQRKASLLRENRRREEIMRRAALPRYRQRKVTLEFERTPKEFHLRVTDEGKGFDWHPYLHISMERLTEINGRGIALARLVSFDRLEYVGVGNEVVCTVKL